MDKDGVEEECNDVVVFEDILEDNVVVEVLVEPVVNDTIGEVGNVRVEPRFVKCTEDTDDTFVDDIITDDEQLFIGSFDDTSAGIPSIFAFLPVDNVGSFVSSRKRFIFKKCIESQKKFHQSHVNFLGFDPPLH